MEPILNDFLLWMFRVPISVLSTKSWETLICKDINFTVISILFKFHQFLPWMWCGYRDHLICLWISVLGGIESVFLWHAEGTACSWASSAPWLWHQNSEQWRRDEQWYRDVSRSNANTARRTTSIFCRYLLFFFCVRTYFFLGFFWLFILATSSGIRRWIDRSLNCKKKHHLYAV